MHRQPFAGDHGDRSASQNMTFSTISAERRWMPNAVSSSAIQRRQCVGAKRALAL
jgi:hypothetical protein